MFESSACFSLPFGSTVRLAGGRRVAPSDIGFRQCDIGVRCLYLGLGGCFAASRDVRAQLYSPLRPLKALSSHSINVFPSTGLLRKHIAPVCIARARKRSSWKAVMKMIGLWLLWAARRLRISTPLMPGI